MVAVITGGASWRMRGLDRRAFAETNGLMSVPTNRLRGSIAPLVTPFVGGAVDENTLTALVDWHVEQGSHGVIVCSETMGESASLTTAERRRVLEIAVEAAACRIDVLVATATTEDRSTVELIEHASRAGADAVVVAASAGDDDEDHDGPRSRAARLAGLAECTALPVIVHRSRLAASADIDVVTLIELIAVAPNVAGLLECTDDLRLVTDAIASFGPSFRILAGVDERTYFMLAAGAHGCVSSIANLLPGRVAELYYAVAKDGFAEGRAAHNRLYDISRALDFDVDAVTIKYLMSRLGLVPDEAHRHPQRSSGLLTARLDELLASSGLLSQLVPSSLR